jgi:predicted flap endonuclease-1-like 5' DNA nuclease
MKAIKVFVLGMLCGLLYKWIIDKVYTDVQIQDITIEDPLPISMVHSELPETKEQPISVNKAVRPKTKKEILEVLKGIGPASVKRLNKAGVFTFDDLALLSPEELRNILGNVLRRAAISETQVIAEAKKFAEQKQTRSE